MNGGGIRVPLTSHSHSRMGCLQCSGPASPSLAMPYFILPPLPYCTKGLPRCTMRTHYKHQAYGGDALLYIYIYIYIYI